MAAKPLISFRADPEINDELKARAAKERRPLAQLVAIMITDHLAAEKADQQRSAA
jgi:hypothetical protein